MNFISKTALFSILVLHALEAYALSCPIPEKIIFRHLSNGAKMAKLDLPVGWDAAQQADSPPVLEFKSRVRSRTSVDQKQLIDRQREFFKGFPAIMKRMAQIYHGHLGRIDPAGCLETSILSSVLAEYPDGFEVEFAVYVLKAKESKMFRAYVLTWGTNHVPESPDLMEFIDRDLKEGWSYEFNLHNHPFFFDNSTGDIGGVVVPSEPDFISYLKDHQGRGLQNAWVTNGFDTFKLNCSEFNQ